MMAQNRSVLLFNSYEPHGEYFGFEVVRNTPGFGTSIQVLFQACLCVCIAASLVCQKKSDHIEKTSQYLDLDILETLGIHLIYKTMRNDRHLHGDITQCSHHT